MVKLIFLAAVFAIGYFAGSRRKKETVSGEDFSPKLLEYKENFENTKEKYDLLTDNIAASVAIRDAEGKVIFCSPFTEVLTGYSLNEIYRYDGDFFKSIAHEDDRQNIERALKVAACGEAFQYRFRFYHKTGISMWAETRTVPILDQSGEVEASLSITLDVTGSVLYQKQVEEKNKDLHDFTYMISHDLKSPIYTIKGMHGILTEELIKTGLSSEIKEPLEHISAAVLRLEKLVANVLDYSKLSAREFPVEKIELSAAFDEVVRDLQHLIKEQKAVINIPSELPAVMSNKDALYQIISNLLGNAIKYKSPERPPQIDVNIARHKNSRLADITVRDNCSGIPQDKLGGIFRPFQRAHSNIEGSGIGLASVKKLLDKTGAQIRVESEEGKGTCFTITMRTA